MLELVASPRQQNKVIPANLAQIGNTTKPPRINENVQTQLEPSNVSFIIIIIRRLTERTESLVLKNAWPI